jgi:hypothetical protein
MVTGTIEITPDAVRAFARSVSSAGGLAGGATRALRSGPPLPGGSEVGVAFTDFRTAWSRALGVITDDVSVCGRAISDAVDGWEAMDQRLAIAGGGRRILPSVQ